MLSLLRRKEANSAKSMCGCVLSASSLTGRGVSYFFLKFIVPGMRSTRAASAVTVMSISSFSCLHSRLKFSATGFHIDRSIASRNVQ